MSKSVTNLRAIKEAAVIETLEHWLHLLKNDGDIRILAVAVIDEEEESFVGRMSPEETVWYGQLLTRMALNGWPHKKYVEAQS